MIITFILFLVLIHHIIQFVTKRSVSDQPEDCEYTRDEED